MSGRRRACERLTNTVRFATAGSTRSTSCNANALCVERRALRESRRATPFDGGSAEGSALSERATASRPEPARDPERTTATAPRAMR
jgi:hypothetical protein